MTITAKQIFDPDLSTYSLVIIASNNDFQILQALTARVNEYWHVDPINAPYLHVSFILRYHF